MSITLALPAADVFKLENHSYPVGQKTLTGLEAGTINQGIVVKVLKVVEPEAATADKLKSLAQRLSGQSGGDLTNAYLGALKEHIKVEVKKGVVQAADKEGKASADAKKG